MTRTASQQGRANRRNGKDTERAVRDHLRRWWPELDYLHPGGPGRTHEGDQGDLGPLHDSDGDHWTCEVKGPRATPSAGDIDRWANEARTEAAANGKGGLWVLIVRRPGTRDVGRWWAWSEVGALADLMGGDACGPDWKGMWRSWQMQHGASLVCVPVDVWVSLAAPRTPGIEP